jgi:hypothetical protein
MFSRNQQKLPKGAKYKPEYCKRSISNTLWLWCGLGHLRMGISKCSVPCAIYISINAGWWMVIGLEAVVYRWCRGSAALGIVKHRLVFSLTTHPYHYRDGNFSCVFFYVSMPCWHSLLAWSGLDVGPTTYKLIKQISKLVWIVGKLVE